MSASLVQECDTSRKSDKKDPDIVYIDDSDEEVIFVGSNWPENTSKINNKSVQKMTLEVADKIKSEVNQQCRERYRKIANNKISISKISPQVAAKIKQDVNQQHRERYKNVLEKKNEMPVSPVSTQPFINTENHPSNKSSDLLDFENNASSTTAPGLDLDQSMDSDVLLKSKKEHTGKCECYEESFTSSKNNNSASVLSNSKETHMVEPFQSKNLKSQRLLSDLLPFKEMEGSSERQTKNENHTLLPEQTNEIIETSKNENKKNTISTSNQVQEIDFVNDSPPLNIKYNQNKNMADLKEMNTTSEDIEVIFVCVSEKKELGVGRLQESELQNNNIETMVTDILCAVSNCVHSQMKSVKDTFLTNDLNDESVTKNNSEVKIVEDTLKEHNKINTTQVDCESKSSSNSVTDENNLKRKTSSDYETLNSPVKMPKLSQELTKHPSKFVGACTSVTDIVTQLNNGVQSPKKKVSPPRRVGKFSPLRFIKNMSSHQKLGGLLGKKIGVSKKLEFNESDTQSLLGHPSSSKYDALFDKQPFVYTDNFYVGHFRNMLLEVMSDKNTVNLINKEELKIIDTYFNMPPENKELYIRMYNRKFMWHRVSKIKYDLDVTSIFRALESQGFIISDLESESLDSILHLLEVPEIKNLCKTYGIPHNKNKKELINTLLQFGKCQKVITVGVDPTTLLKQRGHAILGYCIKLSDISRQIFRRMELLFSLAFLEEGRDGFLNMMRLHNVESGKMVFPTYDIIKDVPIFASRDDLLHYEEALDLEAEVSKAIETKQWDVAKIYLDQIRCNFKQIVQDVKQSEFALNLPICLRKFMAGSAYAYGLYMGIPALKRNETDAEEVLKELLDQEIYLPLYRGRWYEELSLILYKKRKNNKEVTNLIIKAMQDQHVNEVQRHILSKRGRMLLTRKLGFAEPKTEIDKMLRDCLQEPLKSSPFIIINAKSLPSIKPGFKLVYIQENNGLQEKTYSSVEELAISHYRTLGFTKGIHCEGSIVMSLFGIIFWDIIYEIPVPNVFLSKFQPKPLDLPSGEFYQNRKEAIDKRLLKMESWTMVEVCEIIQKQYSEHEGKLSIVNWQWFRNFQEIVDLISCMGIGIMAKLCGRLAKSYRTARSGFPDLVLWTPGMLKCKFVEVKGPGDRLQPNQSLWMDFLVNIGANAEVCHVQKIGSKFLKKTNPPSHEEHE